MIGLIIWLIGLILTVKAALEIWRMNGDFGKKSPFIILIVLTNWLGLVFYSFYGRANMPKWLK